MSMRILRLKNPIIARNVLCEGFFTEGLPIYSEASLVKECSSNRESECVKEGIQYQLLRDEEDGKWTQLRQWFYNDPFSHNPISEHPLYAGENRSKTYRPFSFESRFEAPTFSYCVFFVILEPRELNCRERNDDRPLIIGTGIIWILEIHISIL